VISAILPDAPFVDVPVETLTDPLEPEAPAEDVVK
jgi:hypothetical protein